MALGRCWKWERELTLGVRVSGSALNCSQGRYREFVFQQSDDCTLCAAGKFNNMTGRGQCVALIRFFCASLLVLFVFLTFHAPSIISGMSMCLVVVLCVSHSMFQ
jgi:hypothetical protein